ncbi:MAG TPA: SBBP repeat-containing protein, partial [Candidatus Solibacter sp.]
DPDGNVYLSGTTNSSDFPTTPNALIATSPVPGGYTGFVAKINADATKLLYSTYLGGTAIATDIRGIAIDSARNIYVTGVTGGVNFPVTPGAFRTTASQFSFSAFVTKFNPAGTALVYSTFLGMASGNFGAAQPPVNNMGIAVDSAGNAYVAGSTGDRNFPITGGAFQTTFSQTTAGSGFVTKLNAAGSDLIFSTYLGGSYYDGVDALALGPDGSVYVTGHAASNNFPTTPGAFMTGPNPEFPAGTVIRYPPYGFVSRLKPDGSGLIYSTYIGGGGSIIMGAIAVDSQGNAFVIGAADSTSFPTTPGAIQPCLEDPSGFSNAILFKLDPNGSRLLYSTFLGGNVREQGFGIALDTGGNAYVTGMSDSTTFVSTPGAAGVATGQAFIAKVSFSTPTPAGVTCVANTASMVPGPVAAGEIVSVFGTGLGPTDALAGVVANGAFTTSLGGTRVLFDGVAAPLLMVSGNQINAIVPSPVRFRAQTVMQVEVAGKLLPAQTLDVALSSPAVFTVNGTGTGWAAALNQDGTVNSPANPAARGSVVWLFANSAGPWQPVLGDGLVLADAHPIQIFPTVTLSTNQAPVIYNGNSPGSVTALWQLNIFIPQTIFPSTGLQVHIIGPNALTQRVTIAVK